MSEVLLDPFEKPAVTQGYETYDLLLGSQNIAHPARQGLGEGEYVAALYDPGAAWTNIEVQGATVKIPQLAPLRHIKWLNDEFYAKQFPEAHSNESIMCFNNSLGVELGPEVRVRLKELAEKQGVLVFDYPTSDPEYLERIKGTLTELGIKAGEVQELGTQAYYAGKVKLKNPHDPNEKPQNMASAFNAMVLDGRYNQARFGLGASLHTTLPFDTARRLDEFYEGAFQVLNDHPCKQGLSPEEFTSMVVDDQDVDKIVYSGKEGPESLCILGDDLSKFDWINPTFFQRVYPIEAANNQIVYFPAIATDPNHQNGLNSAAMINLLAELCEAGNNEVIVAYDCCDLNQAFLPKVLEDMINRTPQASIEFKTIDVQRYCAIQLIA